MEIPDKYTGRRFVLGCGCLLAELILLLCGVLPSDQWVDVWIWTLGLTLGSVVGGKFAGKFDK